MGLPIIQINNVTKSFETKDSRVEASRVSAWKSTEGISTELSVCPAQEKVLWYAA